MNEMNNRFTRLAGALRRAFESGGEQARRLGHAVQRGAVGRKRALLALAAAGIGTWALVTHPPLAQVAPGEIGVRINAWTGDSEVADGGPLLVVPGVHELRRFPLRDQIYRPAQPGDAAFQSVEGLSFGADVAVRYAIDAPRLPQLARQLPADIGGQIVQPAVQGVVFKVFARYTVREIFSTKRAEIQQAIENELKPLLAADGVLLRSVTLGKVELPDEYRAGMEQLLAEELQAEKMRYTLDLKEKKVKESELQALADKARRETAAAAAASEQVIAARAQEEAMRHVLPFKHKQIEQRQLEAEADKRARIKQAEAAAEARRIEAAGEAESRQKLAEAEAWRLERIGKVTSAQMAREGELISRHPLLIQKTVADKLSDKVQVIIAPPGANGQFIAAGLVGGNSGGANAPARQGEPQ